MVNIDKPGKERVVFDAGATGATYTSTSLNRTLLKGPDLLNNLVGVLTCFCIRRYAVMGNIEQLFHQFLVENKDRDVLHFLWTDNYIDPIEDYCMNVHLFGKVDPLCIVNWTIKNAADQSDSFDQIFYQTHKERFLHI